MTVPITGITPNFGIEYLIPGEPARNTRAKLQRNAETIDAALTAGGIAPAGAADLVAIAGRVTTLEKTPWTTWGLNAGWSVYAGLGPAVASGPYAAFAYRTVANALGELRGWLTNTAAIAAGARVTASPLPVNLRPTTGVTLWAGSEDSGGVAKVTRFELFTDGHLYTIRNLAINSYLNFDGQTWPR